MTGGVLFRVEVDDGFVVRVDRAVRTEAGEPLVWRECSTFDDLDLLETAVRVARAQRAGRLA